MVASLWLLLRAALVWAGGALGEDVRARIDGHDVAMIAFRDAAPSRTLVIAAHGGLASKESLLPVCWEARARGADCVVVDAVGHGASSALPRTDVVAAMRRGLRAERVLEGYGDSAGCSSRPPGSSARWLGGSSARDPPMPIRRRRSPTSGLRDTLGLVKLGPYTTRVAAPAAALVLVLACVELKDAAPEPESPGPPDPYDAAADGATPPPDASASNDGGTSLEGGTAADLAAKRKRLSDAPTLPQEWIASDCCVYVVLDASGQPKLRRLRPSDGSSVDYTFQLGASGISNVAASDAYVVVRRFDRADVYDATMPATLKYAELDPPSEVIGLGTKKVAWLQNSKEIYVFDPAVDGAPVKTHTSSASLVTILGRRGENAFVRDVQSLDLWLTDSSAKWVLPAAPTAVTGVDGATSQVIVQHSSPGGLALKLVTRDGPTRDLTAEIMAATSPIAPAMRQGIGGLVQTGRWIVYSAIGGLLAFDLASGSLVPCQMPRTAGAAFRAPHLLATGLLVFELRGGDEALEGAPGIYGVDLADVLPP